MKQLLLFGAIVSLMATLATAYPRPEHETREKFEEIPLQGSVHDKDFLRPRMKKAYDPNESVHHFTESDEEIEQHRWISIDHNGIETTATDNEVIAILEKAQKHNNSVSQSHFPVQASLYIDMMVKKRKVIGTDGRYKHPSVGHPYCAIGQLENGCTAFLVGPYHAITARHCVYNCNEGVQRLKSGRGMYLRRNCNSPGIFMDDVTTIIPSNVTCTDTGFDIAWILLNNTNYTSDCWIGSAYRNPMPTMISGEVCGYPQDKPIATGAYKCLYCSRCGDIEETSSKKLKYTCDTNRGMSGSPVFTAEHDNTDEQFAYGVHTLSSRDFNENQGTRFDSFFFEWTKNWTCAAGINCDV